MLIVCPNCATSYMIDPASVGPSGRAVRCARCKSTWFAGPSKQAGPPSVSAFVDSVIAEAEADAKTGTKSEPNPPPFAAFDRPVNTAPNDTAFDMPTGDQPAFSPQPAPEVTADSPAMEPAMDGQNFDQPSHFAPAIAVGSFEHDGAEPVTIADAPPLAPPMEPPGEYDSFHGTGHNETDDGEDFVARRRRMKAKRSTTKRMSRWTAVILVLFAVNVALIGARHELVRYLPQTASLFAAIGLPVNLRNLEFENINISKEAQDGVNILIIDGKIVNTAGKAADVPRLRFAARNAGGQEVYTWTAQPTRSILGPGESLPFTSRLAAPPADATDILVRFFTAQDAARGMK
ncbi:MAG: DUF3426 domain-containing protein [Pseudolabrys sp.]|jgi:predicted Zn finger-like uncharacterized protein